MSSTNDNALQIADNINEHDAFGRWLGIKVIDILPGFCQLQMVVTAEMCNGLQLAHGGVIFSLADSCCAYAVNCHGRKSVSVDTSINQFKGAKEGDTLRCICKEISLGKKLSVYTAEITNQDGDSIALFKGTYYRTDKRWINSETQQEETE